MSFSIGRLRWWQGAILGALTGTSAYALRNLPELWRAPAMVRGLSVDELAELAASPAQNGSTPTLSDIVIHPPSDGRQLLTAKLTEDRKDHPIELLAPIPFVVSTQNFLLGKTAHSYPDVRSYLASAAPRWRYRYAWWEMPRVAAGLWIGGPMIALGLLLPLALRGLITLGIISRPPVVVEPPPAPARAPEPPPTEPATDPAIAAAKLAALETDLDRRMTELQAGDSEEPVAAPESLSAVEPVRLNSDPVPAQEAPAKDPTSFDGGEFYPVHRRQREP